MFKNPYKFLGPLDPVKDHMVCVPRHEEVERVIKGIERGAYYAVLGPRMIGKTTFLRQIIDRYSNAFLLYFNFEISPSDEEKFYRWIIEQFLRQIPHRRIPAKGNGSSPEFAFFNFLENFRPKDRHKKVILLFDEVERIPSLDSFLHIWRKIFHERIHAEELNKYAVIMAGGQELLEITAGPRSIFNIAKMLTLKDFSPEESRQLIDEPFKQLNITFDERAKDKLVKHLGGHPQMLQQSCHLLVERAQEKKAQLVEKDVFYVFDYLLETNVTLKTFSSQVMVDKKLSSLIKNILNGENIKYHLYKEFSIMGVGPVVEGPNSLCVIRNKIYEDFLKYIPAAPPEKLLIKEPSRDNFLDHKKKKPMPCAIKQIQVKNYHGIIETGIHLPVDARWIFLTGENAYGKTAILRTLAIGLFGSIDEKKILLDLSGKSEIDVEIYNNRESLINSVGTSDFKPFTRFAAYGPSRLEIQSDRTMNEITGRSMKTYSLFNDDGVSLNIERELVLWYLDADPKYAVVRDILLELMPHGADIMVDRVKKEVLYIEKESEEDGGASFEPIRFNELAAGNKSIIAMIGDLIVRFYKEYEALNPDIHPKDFEGIAIIDELDLHLHPKWLWRLPGILSNVFPKIQFIASTHSEISLLGAPKESVFLKVTRTQKEGIQIQRLPIDIKNLLSHHLLTSPIFDMEEESIQAGNDKLSDVRTEDSFKKIKKIDKIKEELRTLKPNDRERLKSLLEDTD